MTESKIYIKENNISPSRYIRYTLGAYMKVWWGAYVLPLVVCAALSVVNINFIFVAIVLLFLVFTMILFMVVVYYGIVPESRYSTLPKDMELDDSGIHIRMKRQTLKDIADEESLTDYEIEELIIKWDAIKKIEAKDECLLLMFKRPRYSFLAVPYTAFYDVEHLRMIVSFIGARIG